ncbi:hypothetical protein [Streptomyces adelaidensis]|uniref:hypothetical protein n=1 Tax=Streptomyces adelaidensis TaxID=2796465 RepID=UPI0019051F7F|nr:hypothetical protein [Streptomyces adelaidensis]
MTDHRLEGPGEHGDPVPRDLPDQQANTGEDPWEVAPARATDDEENDEPDRDRDDERAAEATDVPDTDEAGTGRRGVPQSAPVNPEQPVPDESSG